MNMTMKIPKNYCGSRKNCPCTVIKKNVSLKDIRIRKEKK